MVLTLRERLHKSDVRSRPRQGRKPGRKRRWRGFHEAPSGAGRGVSPRIPRIGAELGAWSRPRPADGARGRRGRGDMFGRSSYAIVRRCKSSIFFVAIRSAMEVLRPRRHEGVRWRSRSTLRVADTAFTGEKEVPLDAARLAGMTCRARGERGKRWAAEMVSLATERLPRRPSFPFPSSGGARHSAADARRWRNPILASERSRGGGIPADDRCVMHGVDTTGTPAQVRCQMPAPPGAKAR